VHTEQAAHIGGMSITIEPESYPEDLTGWRIEHADGTAWEDEPYPTYDSAEGGYLEHNLRCRMQDCVQCGGHISAVTSVELPSLNMANGNAAKVLSVLGCSSEDVYCGGTAFEPEDFRDRVVVALALADTDPGRPASTTSSPGGGTFVECGVPAGYLQDRLSELLEVADFAVAHGRQVIAC
jgi:hypothetical protein